MRLCILAVLVCFMLGQAHADTAEHWITALRAQGIETARSERARLNRRAGLRLVVHAGETQIVRDLAHISRTSALEEAYVHINDRTAVETGVLERFQITTSDCLVRATVRSSITIPLLARLPGGLPDKLVWYHVHPSRDIINQRFRAKRCAPPNTWPVLPSSADFSQFLKRAKSYYATKPDGQYADRIVIDPIGVVELRLTVKGRAVIHEFRHVNNYDTQEYGNDSMPGHKIWPQRYIQRLNMLIDRIQATGPQLDRSIARAVDLLSSEGILVTFTPMREFQSDR